MTDTEAKLNYIRQMIPTEQLYIQLAEEASELAQAATKMARCYSKHNKPAKDYAECCMSLSEEHADVRLILELLDWSDSDIRKKIREEKVTRWVDRIREEQSKVKFR